LASLSSILQARWKGGKVTDSKPQEVRAGQVRSFRISDMDAAAKKIEVELVTS
jgi:small subunit ribosomal protein S1